jgi:hypothetical protein
MEQNCQTYSWKLGQINFKAISQVISIKVHGLQVQDKTLAEFSTLEAATSELCTYASLEQNCLT